MKFFVKGVFARDYKPGSGYLSYLMPPSCSVVMDKNNPFKSYTNVFVIFF